MDMIRTAVTVAVVGIGVASFALWLRKQPKHQWPDVVVKLPQSHKEFSEMVQKRLDDAEQRIAEFGRTFLDGRTFEDFKVANPRAFDSNGKFKACPSCGGTSIWMKEMGHTRFGVHHGHLCRQCGKELWRSNQVV